MGPKKKERDTDHSSSSKGGTTTNNGRVADSVQADHELFLQAFEKPTQIYRYLRTRHFLSPIFLHRTLSYMNGRCTRNHQNRKTCKLVNLLDSKLQKNSQNDVNTRSKYMTLTFLGFYDPQVNGCREPVKVETLLLQIGHKKRKDVSSPIMQISVGTTEVCINPSEESPPPKAPTVSISTEDLSFRNGQQGNSYVLLLRVSAPIISESEPQPKRRRLSDASLTTGMMEETTRLFGAELVVYDRHSRCLLIDGDYELAMKEITSPEPNGTSPGGSDKSMRLANASWSTVDSSHTAPPLNILIHGPMLKFRLEWANDPISALVDRPKPYVASASTQTTDKSSSSTSSSSSSVEKSQINSVDEPTVVRYQFLYNASRRQQTETRSDFRCPWCSLHCLQLPALLKHLRLCHSRFNFSHVGTEKGHVRIDISVNEAYDGSYSGNPHDLIAQPLAFGASSGGAAFGRQGPTRRTPITATLVWRPRRMRASGHDPLQAEGDDGYEVCETQRPFITGHNRLYHHTSTCLPIQAKELDVDSENETDPEWLRAKTCMMIDEFTDVNEGEKELMKLWNLHVLKHNYVGDCQMGVALQMFLDAHGQELLKRNLYRNFILHLSNLYDFGIIAPATVLRTITSLQLILQRSPEHQEILKQAWLGQVFSKQEVTTATST
ncbi:polycomb protein SUZ12-like [Daphnia carinata]|uniref:polycomb protein SUZ12-like n=1 Tax=Daphnia carinata TaxID=120202 RepID=UPI00257F2910|nr:polycomb protein SUZ12-like [Daphnia carinata]